MFTTTVHRNDVIHYTTYLYIFWQIMKNVVNTILSPYMEPGQAGRVTRSLRSLGLFKTKISNAFFVFNRSFIDEKHDKDDVYFKLLWNLILIVSRNNVTGEGEYRSPTHPKEIAYSLISLPPSHRKHISIIKLVQTYKITPFERLF